VSKGLRFILAVNSFVTVSGIFVLRWRQPELPRPYRTFLYPLPPVIYLLLTGWTLGFTLVNRPQEALVSMNIMGTGLVIYWISTSKTTDRNTR